MVIFILKVTPSSCQREEILQVLRCVEGPISIKAGCLFSEIYEKVSDEPAILYMEFWNSFDMICHHIRSELFTKILIAMEMSSKQPEIHFYDLSKEWGLDLVEELRSESGCKPERRAG